MARRYVGWVICLAAALTLATNARADFLYTDDFDRADLGANYTVNNATAEIVGNVLRVHSSTTTGQNGVTSVAGLFPAPGAGSFIRGDVSYSWPAGGGANNVFLKLGGNIGHRAGGNRHGFWDNGWSTGGSNQVTGAWRDVAVLYVGGPGDNWTAHTFVDKQYNTSFTDDLDQAGQMVGPTGNSVHMRHQVGGGKENRSDIYSQYDNLEVFVLENNGAGAGAAVKAGLALKHSDNFNRADDPNIGANWTEQTAGGTVEIGLVANQVEIEITQVQSGTPWGRATLDLTAPGVLGRGLEVGEYAEFDLRRRQDRGNLGLFAGVGNHQGFTQGAGGLKVWCDRFGTDQGSAWCTTSPAGVGFDPDDWLTLGLRLDYADGEIAVVSYYVDDDYAGSWLFDTGATTLDSLTFFGQSNQVGDGYEFDNLRVYAAAEIPEPCTLALLAAAGAGLGAYVRRRRPNA